MKKEVKNKRKAWTHLSVGFHIDGRNDFHEVLVHHRCCGRHVWSFLVTIITLPSGAVPAAAARGRCSRRCRSWFLTPLSCRTSGSRSWKFAKGRLFKRSCAKIRDNASVSHKKHHLTLKKPLHKVRFNSTFHKREGLS